MDVDVYFKSYKKNQNILYDKILFKNQKKSMSVQTYIPMR